MLSIGANEFSLANHQVPLTKPQKEFSIGFWIIAKNKNKKKNKLFDQQKFIILTYFVHQDHLPPVIGS